MQVKYKHGLLKENLLQYFLRLLKESIVSKTLSRAFEVSALDSAVTLRFSGSLVGVTVCIRKLLFVYQISMELLSELRRY